MDRTSIAVDAMGGDGGSKVVVQAVLSELTEDPLLDITLVGDEVALTAQIQNCLVQFQESSSVTQACRRRIPKNLSFINTDTVISMADSPAQVLRGKPNSSIHKMVDLLCEGQVQSAVSAGNTGALMAVAKNRLGMLPGIDRPAICSPIPTQTGHCYWLDLGANVACSAAQLHQFSQLGSALSRVLDGISSPKVAVFNVGHERSKGSQDIKQAAKLIADDPNINFSGYIEGDHVFSGAVDVVICDGFVGNVAVKVCEGTASFVSKLLASEFADVPRDQYFIENIEPVLQRVYQRVEPDHYDGGVLLGLNGVVMKSHGNTTVYSVRRAIKQAKYASQKYLLATLRDELK